MLERFKYTDKEKKELLNSLVIIVDTREKDNEHILREFKRLGRETIKRKLDYGDYSLMLPKNESLGIDRPIWFDKEIMLERKASLEELSGNFTQNRTRFEEEMAMAPKNKILLIENGDYARLLEGQYDTSFNANSFTASLHSFYWKYNLPFIFIEKEESGEFIVNYLVSFVKQMIR